MSFVLTGVMIVYLHRENQRRDRWAVENHMTPDMYTAGKKYEERDKGDNATFYRYTL
jgi:hypothetical protein